MPKTILKVFLALSHLVFIQSVKSESVSCSAVSDSATLWTIAGQAPQSMASFRQEYRSGLPLPPLGDLPYPGIAPGSPALQADSEPPGWIVESESHSVVSTSLRPHGPYSPWNSPGQDTGVGSLSLLQGIFPTQGWNPSLPHCRWILYQLSHQGSPYYVDE